MSCVKCSPSSDNNAQFCWNNRSPNSLFHSEMWTGVVVVDVVSLSFFRPHQVRGSSSVRKHTKDARAYGKFYWGQSRQTTTTTPATTATNPAKPPRQNGHPKRNACATPHTQQHTQHTHTQKNGSQARRKSITNSLVRSNVPGAASPFRAEWNARVLECLAAAVPGKK